MRAPASKHVRRAAPALLSVRLRQHVALETHGNGEIAASFNGYSVGLGSFSPAMAQHMEALRRGVPRASLAKERGRIGKEFQLFLRQLAERGFLEFCLGHGREAPDLVVIEPQQPGYWPQIPKLADSDRLILSRFAYLRRRGSDFVLESPRAGALLKICDPQLAAFIAQLSHPQRIRELRRQGGFPGAAFLALLVDCEIALKLGKGEAGFRPEEGDSDLMLWDFHDLLFHTRSTQGRHTNPLGAAYPFVGLVAPLPAIRPSWPGKKIDLHAAARDAHEAPSPAVQLLHKRHSTRSFDAERPITLHELARLLANTARILARSNDGPSADDGGHTVRPYPSAGASYELELYLNVDKCEGLARGFYHYDAAAHALTRIDAAKDALDAQLKGAEFAMGTSSPPQILITIAARFGRITWKYSAISYSLILKDVGVLMQTLYLMLEDMRLGGCAIGITNIELFAKMTGLPFHVEGAVGHFAIGRGAPAPE